MLKKNKCNICAHKNSNQCSTCSENFESKFKKKDSPRCNMCGGQIVGERSNITSLCGTIEEYKGGERYIRIYDMKICPECMRNIVRDCTIDPTTAPYLGEPYMLEELWS